MKLMVIGSGGREHALVSKLAQSAHVTQKHKAWLIGEVVKGKSEARVE